MQGAPKITLRGLRIEGNDDAPAVDVMGGEDVLIQECLFVANGASAIVVRAGGHVLIRDCKFMDNGRAAESHGGALRAEGGRVSVERSLFVNNRALYGGALYADNSSVVIMMGTVFRKNMAAMLGGVCACHMYRTRRVWRAVQRLACSLLRHPLPPLSHILYPLT